MKQAADESGRQAFDAIWDAVIGPGISRALAPLGERRARAPETLLHFTSAAGLEGLLRSEVFRLSRARSSNDPMEVEHGLRLARDLVVNHGRGRDPRGTVAGAVLAGLEGSEFYGRRYSLPDPHVCCFAEPTSKDGVPLASSLPHWSLYGRNGAGFVLVFDGRAINELKNVDWFPMTYSEGAQRAQLEAVVAVAEETAKEAHRRALELSPAHAEKIVDFSLHAFSGVVAMHAATMKRPEFKFEHEWRLMLFGIGGVTLDGPQLEYDVDAHGPVLRGFYKCPFPRSALKEIIVGAKYYDLNEPVLAAFLDTLKWNVPIRRGEVNLRTWGDQ